MLRTGPSTRSGAQYGTEAPAWLSKSRLRESTRPLCLGALEQPPACLPASLLLQRDAVLQRSLEAAELNEDFDIALDDGLLGRAWYAGAAGALRPGEARCLADGDEEWIGRCQPVKLEPLVEGSGWE